MDPLTAVLTFPISGPMGALAWIARQIANAAEQQMLDPARIETALRELERRLEDGRIDEPAFEAEEALLLAELEDIKAQRAARMEAGS
ncbi:MAG TPA: gas vesicle protein GvpG [Rhodopila sp.]|nr:gas vesicle protein GvpG [Rhodopila sp.]